MRRLLPPSRFFGSVLRLTLGALLPALGACRDSGPTDVVPPTVGPVISSLIALPASVNLQPGQQRGITVEARDGTGQLISTPSVTWRSDAPTTASVDASGMIRAIAPGAARITATSGAVSALVQVGVSGAAPGIAQWRMARAGLSDVTILGL